MIIKLPSKILVGIFKNTIYALIVSVIFSGYLHPQNLRYFENYQPLQAMGEMPDEFIEYSFSKVSRDFQNLEADDLTARERRDFIKGVHYGIDQLIHSGIVLYGDPISQYVTKVGEQLISNEPGLSHLRFYTFRSNIVNAFSTHQGIIFVSQGLIAQVENEAQLAFILAHEIAHYIEKHVIQNYIDVVDLSKSRSSNDSKLKQLSQYSREKEFEADEIGIEIYHKAGYTKKNLYGMFDVLAYSYLPFDLKDIPNDYWNTNLLYIPKYLLKDNYPEISFDKDYNDSKSSHPNIKSRTEKLEQHISGYSNWGNVTYYFSEEEFKKVQTISRFESVRNDLFNLKYAEALYSIFLLEENYPDNIYLDRCKAHAWAQLVSAKIEGRYSDIITKPRLVQGPAHKLNYFLAQMTKLQVITVGLRIVRDLHLKYPIDEELNVIYNFTLKALSKSSLFKIDDFHDKPYPIADKLNTKKDSTQIENENNLTLSPKTILKTENPQDDFHLYALSDLVTDSYFINTLENYRTQIAEEKELRSQLLASKSTLNKKELKTFIENQQKLGINNLILLEPQIRKTNDQNKSKPIKSEKLQVKLNDVLNDFENPPNFSLHTVSRGKYELHGTDMYNDRSTIIRLLMQLSEFQNSMTLPVDFSFNKILSEKYNTSKAAFILIESHFNYPFDLLNTIYYVMLPPYALFHLPFQMTKMFQTQFNLVVFDINTFQIDTFIQNNFRGVTNKATLNALFYDMIITLQQKAD